MRLNRRVHPVPVVLAALGFAASRAAAPPRIEVAGTVRFPAEAPAADGAAVAVTGLSGVAWLGDDRWITVTDTGAALVEFALDLQADGTPGTLGRLRAVRFASRHDYEDVIPCPPEIARRFGATASLVVCEEDTPGIHLVDASGAGVGAVPLPGILMKRRPNRGLEALCAAADGKALWTATEESLPDDGPPPSPGVGNVVRLVELPAAGQSRGKQVAYAVDPPHACVPVAAGDVYSGVVALAALPDGRLLVLERSAARGLPPFENRIYVVDPVAADDVADVVGRLAARPEVLAAKHLAWRGALGCNLEGLGLGPPLAGGGTALVAIADAGGLDAPNQLVVLRLLPPVTSP